MGERERDKEKGEIDGGGKEGVGGAEKEGGENAGTDVRKKWGREGRGSRAQRQSQERWASGCSHLHPSEAQTSSAFW